MIRSTSKRASKLEQFKTLAHDNGVCEHTRTLTDFLHHGLFKKVNPLSLHVAGEHPVGVDLRVSHHKETSQNVVHTLGIPDVWRTVGRRGGAAEGRERRKRRGEGEERDMKR